MLSVMFPIAEKGGLTNRSPDQSNLLCSAETMPSHFSKNVSMKIVPPIIASNELCVPCGVSLAQYAVDTAPDRALHDGQQHEAHTSHMHKLVRQYAGSSQISPYLVRCTRMVIIHEHRRKRAF